MMANLAAWSAQVAALVAAAAALTALLRLSLPRARLVLWQALLGICLLLPFAQPWRPASQPATAVAAQVGEWLVRPGAAPVAPTHPFPLAATAVAVLVAGAAARLAWLTLGFVRLARLRRAAQPLDDPLPPPLMRARVLAGADATFALADTPAGPSTFGLRRPVVVLPRAFLDFDPAFQTTVACHELLHVRRRDWAWSIAEELVVALLWFHPAVWWLVAQIHLSREQVIDAEVVRLTGQRKPYVEALVHLAGARPPAALTVATPLLRRRHLARRVALILTEAPMSKIRLVVSVTGVVLALATTGAISVAAFPLVSQAPAAVNVPQQTPPPPPKPPQVVFKVNPVYPEEAKAEGLSGTVIIDVTLDAEGIVANAELVRGNETLGEAALAAVRQWRYEPPGEPRHVYVAVNFSLDDHDAAGTDRPAVNAAPSEQSVPAAPERLVQAGDPTAPPPPKLVYEVKPTYPLLAQKAKVRGVVELELTIEPDGTVSDARVLRSIPLLDEAAIDAARQWKFEPPGRRVVADVEITFTLKDHAARDPWTVTFATAAVGANATIAGTDYALRTVVYPAYPPDALAAGLEGSVHLIATLHADGTFTDVQAVDGPKPFRQISVDAVRKWIAGRQLTPASGNVPVAIGMLFQIRNGGSVSFGITVK